jgi:membrane protein DedA with SNARE-associated domain
MTCIQTGVGDAVEFLLRHGYLVLFAVVLGEQLGLPLLGAPVLLASGALAAMGQFWVPAALLLAIGACLVADSLWYGLGRWRGASVLTLICRISLEPDSCVRQTEDVFVRHGAPVLLGAKFLPGLNTVAPPLAGVVGMGPTRFFSFDGAGAFFWSGTYVGLGYLFSTQLEAVARALGQFGAWAGALVGAGLGAYIACKYGQRRRFLHGLRTARITAEELLARLRASEPALVVDLRSEVHAAYDGMRIPGALRLAPEELDRRHSEIPRDREIVLYCS